jgi:SAM-dependent methyltransferase
LPLREAFDKVFISFVLHGFPQYVRELIIKNVFEALKSNGSFFVLDYDEFSYKEMPFYLKIPFNLMECVYAFDFIEKDWKEILQQQGFDCFKEHHFFQRYVRLLTAKKM